MSMGYIACDKFALFCHTQQGWQVHQEIDFNMTPMNTEDTAPRNKKNRALFQYKDAILPV